MSGLPRSVVRAIPDSESGLSLKDENIMLPLFLIVSKSESSPDEESDKEISNCFGGSGDKISIDLLQG